MQRVLITFAAVAAFVSSHALAEEARIPAGVFFNAQSADEYLAKDTLVGAKVVGPDGKIVGDIEDLIVNDYNQVVGVVMGTGGFFGIAEKKVGVALSALKFDEADGKTTVSLPEATKEVLDAVEAYKRTQPAKSLLQRAKEKAKELSDKTSASSRDAMEKAKPALEQAKEKAKEAGEKAKEALEKAKESAGPALDAAKAAVKDAVEKAKEAAAPAMEKAKEAVKEAVDAAKEAAKPAPAETPAPAPEAMPAPAPEAAPAPAPEAAPAPDAPATP